LISTAITCAGGGLRGHGLLDDAAHLGFDRGRLLPGSCGGPVSTMTLPGTTLVFVPPSMRPTLQVG